MIKNDNKPLVIYGTGDFALIVYEVALESGLEVAAFTSDATETPVVQEGLPPYISRSFLLDSYPPDRYDVFIGFLRKDLMSLRSERFNEVRSLGYNLPNLIQPSACVYGSLGQGNLLMAGAMIGPRSHIGNGNVLWQNCVLSHDNEIGDFNNISPTASFSGYSKTGSHTLIGNGAVLNNHVSVGDWALVGAGAYARKDVPSGCVLVPPQSYILEEKKD